MANEIVFNETQKFRQWWLWIILLLVFVITTFVAFQMLRENEFQNNNTPLVIVASSVLFILLPAVLLFLYIKLETQVKEDGIYVRFFPFHRTFSAYKWDDILRCFIRQYNPIGEYGGWGLRVGTSGKAFNVSGDSGLQLELADHKKLLIGTSKPAELLEVLQKIGQLKP